MMQKIVKFAADQKRLILTNTRSSRSYFIQNMCSKKSRKIHRNTPALESLSNKSEGLRHRCFLVNFKKILKKIFYPPNIVALLKMYQDFAFSKHLLAELYLLICAEA